ncbi:MAG: MATE family efflux transporter [Lachnospiraceae bacterium]|nr:MATE family efflux transporter [Lachnospiraceae bacterium]
MKAKSLLKEFLQYVIMNVIGMIGLSCYILADTFFVSKGLGSKGLTALNLAIPIYSFVHGSGLMIGMGGATRYSIFRGEKSDKNAQKVFAHGIYLAGIFIVFFVFLGLGFTGNITKLLGADKEVFSMTETYIKYILMFSPAFILNDVMVCFIRNDGNPRLSMIAMLVGSFSNILLDYIFIFPLKMGIFGAVLATGLAPVISLGILWGHWLTKKSEIHFKHTKPSVKMFSSIMSLGVPSLITEVALGIVIIIFNIMILRLQGNVGVAAYGVIANLSLVVTAIFTGIAQGMQPLTSRAYGHGDNKNLKQIFRYAMVTMVLVSISIYLLLFGLANPIVGVFNQEQNIELQEIAVSGLKLYFTAIPFMGFNIILAMFFTSIQKAAKAQVISFARGFVVIIPMAFILSYLAGLTGIWLAMTVTEGLVSVIGIGFLYLQKRRERKLGKGIESR